MNTADDDGFETLSGAGSSRPRKRAASGGQAFRAGRAAPGDSGGSSAEGARDPGGRSLKARAIGFLSRREYSRMELQRKLAPHAESEQELSALLDDLERGNWLSTERYAQSLVHRKAARQGAALILQELRQHGVNAQSIADIGKQLRDSEYDRALAVWQKKFGHAPLDAKDYARQLRFLASRGFSPELLRTILRTAGNDDEPNG